MIREATHDDIPEMVKMGENFITSTSYKDVLSFNETQLATLLRRLIDTEMGLLLVAESSHIKGAIGMVVHHHPMSDELVSSEAFWWINKEDRSGFDAVRLVLKAEAWVGSQGARWAHMVAPNEKVGKFYERLGYTPLEMHYTKAVR
jgi:GNAT superfamily N-acetyltransferase